GKKVSKRTARPSKRGPVFGGRWSRVADLVDLQVSATERAHARALALLERYGVVSREAAAAEDLPGGFSAVYPVLKAMEEAGKIRRGYFVEGLSGAQFAYAGAVERLRASRDDDGAETAQLVAATDPANPYGILFPWPERPSTGDGEATSRKPRRLTGAWVILWRGAPLAYVDASGHGLMTFPALWASDEALRHGYEGLRTLASRRRGQALYIRQVDGLAALAHPHRRALQQAGMGYSFDGLTVGAQ
ncbi:MAG TPA: DEAD/DEAH box helicase, partial [Myxococcota bacterium]|nr:DEAD/DEAH box helicase [Myxococcota bacterium]